MAESLESGEAPVFALTGRPGPLSSRLPPALAQMLASSWQLIQERQAQTEALERDLAVDYALALAAFDVTQHELADAVGVSHRVGRRLLKVAARTARRSSFPPSGFGV